MPENVPSKSVSIIVPAYNTGRYVTDCIRSLLGQRDHLRGNLIEDIEVIVVDDGSTDDTGAICDRLGAGNSRLRVFHTSNGGPSAARNTGISHASGKYLMFVDSDDMLHPHCVSILLQQASLHAEGAVICSCFTSRLPEDEAHPSPTPVKARSYTPLKAVRKALYQTSRINASMWGKLFDRKIFSETGLKFREGYYFEDMDLFYKTFLAAPEIVMLNSVLYYYRRNNESFLGHWQPKRLDVLSVVTFMEEYVRERHLTGLYRAVNERVLSANFNIMCHSAMTSNRIPRPISDNCWKEITSRRWKCLLNPHVRLKSKFGILLSLAGRNRFCAFVRKFPGKYIS